MVPDEAVTEKPVQMEKTNPEMNELKANVKMEKSNPEMDRLKEKVNPKILDIQGKELTYYSWKQNYWTPLNFSHRILC